MRAALVAMLLFAAIPQGEARNNRPREPTDLDNTTWKIKSINGRPLVSRVANIGFYSNGRVQLHTVCSFMMAGDFSVSIWGLRTHGLDPPRPSLACSDTELMEERDLNSAIANLRSYRLANDGRRLLLKARGDLELIAER